MSTASHPETDGQTERANRVVEDVLRSFARSFRSWCSFLPMVEFAINNAEHASTGLTPFYINFGRHPRVSALLGMERPIGPDGERDDDTGCERDHDENSARVNGVLTQHGTRSAARRRRGIELQDESGAGEVAAPPPSNFLPNPEPQPRDAAAVNAFLQQRESVMRYVRDAIATAVDRQKEYADQRGRKNLERFAVGDRVLLSTAGIQPALVTNLGASKLAPRYVGPFKILKVPGDAYMVQLPTALRLHPTFYVGRLRCYHPAAIPSDADAPTVQRPDPGPSAAAPAQRSAARDEPPSVPAPGAPSAPARAAAAVSPRPPPVGHAARFRRDGPAPLVDSAGHERHIVEAILRHDDSRRAVPQRALYVGNGFVLARHRNLTSKQNCWGWRLPPLTSGHHVIGDILYSHEGSPGTTPLTVTPSADRGTRGGFRLGSTLWTAEVDVIRKAGAPSPSPELGSVMNLFYNAINRSLPTSFPWSDDRCDINIHPVAGDTIASLRMRLRQKTGPPCTEWIAHAEVGCLLIWGMGQSAELTRSQTDTATGAQGSG
ncbi:unnamed protein product [Phytophthora fragariaefolia]|uniref:Unnamed protein product n=1 Tax=Phytophthora fragariaefolia TaxID=1490495 RepID=A0A9W6XW37_9STRA|nr:unnamed protein product [Phytophthora fragariaefolia]